MRSIVLIGVLGGVLAGCSSNVGQEASSSVAARKQRPVQSITPHAAPAAQSTIADLPDRGALLAYTAAAPVTFGASTWREVKLSEARAIRAIADRGMVVEAPDGRPIPLQYARHVEHADGNWTWVGRPAGANAGEDAILTFGPKAVFGMIPDGKGGALEVTTRAGKTYIGQSKTTIADSAAMAADMLQAPTPSTASSVSKTPRVVAAAAPASAAAASVSAQAAGASASKTTVDLVAGYTLAFASRLGGNSQAVTRLDFLVDIANQAYANSGVAGQLRLVATVPVNYADATLNRTALLELTGVTCTTVSGPGQRSLPDRRVNCTTAATPTALKPLLAVKAAYGADLGVLVRNYSVPENGTCGVAWLLGGGQVPVTAADARFGLAVVSDSNGTAFPSGGSTCGNATLVHELGHNMGLAHNIEEAQGSTDSNGDGNLLDPEEYGRFADSFGYSTDSTHGNFYTIMSVPVPGQTAYRVFSSPNLMCGTNPCGIAGQADNVRTLGLTMPVVASFGTPKSPGVWLRGDFDGDGHADLFWRNSSTGADSIWRSANSSTLIPTGSVADFNWSVVGSGDFDGDGRSDVVWRNSVTGASSLWKGGNIAQSVKLGVAGADWSIVGAGDFDGDGKDDLLWRNGRTGANALWKGANVAKSVTLATVSDPSWIIFGVGDFDGDGKADILWRNIGSGANSLWKGANARTSVALGSVSGTAWGIVGVADFNGDGKADILWRNSSTGDNAVWQGANSRTSMMLAAVPNLAWTVGALGDFNADGKADILWHNTSTGANQIWLGGNASTVQAVTRVPNLAWWIAA